MAIYIITGKLGGGKTLAAVSKINDAIGRGHRVATNLDLDLVELPACTRSSKSCRVVRVPDRPSVDDIGAIGFGIEGVNSLADARRSYDESKFGLLVLDECGTWLNSREWQAEGRRELINYLLHIRKYLWHVYFIIQDVSALDKQARKALAEHVVYCRRMDRIAVPIIGTVVGWFWGDRLKLPQMHLAIVKYGDQPQSMTVDKWWYKGSDLFRAYDTTQVFMDDYEHGVYSLLPPWYKYRKSLVSWSWRNRMRLTQIYLRQYSRTVLLAAGVFLGAVGLSAIGGDGPEIIDAAIAAPVVTDENQPEIPALGASRAEAQGVLPLVYRLRFDGLYSPPGRAERVFFSDGEKRYSRWALLARGVTIAKVENCRWRLDQGPDVTIVGCYE